MEKEVETKVRILSDVTRTVLLAGGAIVTITLYVHATFATNSRVDKLENKVSVQEEAILDQGKISCLTAIEVGVGKDKLPRICNLDQK